MGGSRKWCPKCGKVHNVKVIPPDWDSFGRYGNGKQRNFYLDRGDEKIHFFKRNMQCLDTYDEWYSAEINYDDLIKLVDSRKLLSNEKEMHIKEINDLTVANRKLQLVKTSLENSEKIFQDGCQTRDEAIVILEKRISDRDRRLELLETLNKAQAKQIGKRNEEIESLKTALIDVSIEHEKQLGKLRELQNAIRVVMKHAEFEVEVDV
jgi:hypothetical protein